jgi:C4-dicarboxylate transporter, DctM subunit
MGRSVPHTLASRLLDIIGWIPSLAVGAMMVTIVADSGLRYLVSGSVPAAFDLSQFWYMILIGFGALALAQRRGEHIEATFIYDLLPDPFRRWWSLLGTVLTVAVMGLIAWTTWEFAEVNRFRGEFSSGSGLPIWPVRYIVPLGAFALALELILGRITDRRTAAAARAAHDAEHADGAGATTPRIDR